MRSLRERKPFGVLYVAGHEHGFFFVYARDEAEASQVGRTKTAELVPAHIRKDIQIKEVKEACYV